MKTQQLISAGFAITALAAASVPGVAFTLLGEMVEQPVASAALPSEAPSLVMAEVAAPLTVSYRFFEPSDRKDETTTW